MATELNSSITESPLQTSNLIKQGAEARVYEHPFEPIAPLCIIKERFRKSYRIAALDERLTRHRVTTEARCLVRLRRAGLDTPRLYHVDVGRGLLYMEFVKGLSVRDYLVCETAAPTGLNSAGMHPLKRHYALMTSILIFFKTVWLTITTLILRPTAPD